MSKGPPKDIARSVHQRLLNEAKRTGRPFNELLQYYGMERLLYRLSVSPHAGRFVLKGALLFTAWRAPMYRPTGDIDLLGRLDNSPDSIAAVFRAICRQDVEPDGLVFDADALTAGRIAEDADYAGVRVSIRGQLGNARINLHVDIGFSDVIVPAPIELEYPVILDLPSPHLRGYSRESVVAEKLEAMVKLGELNSRMKDFHDVWYLARHFDFDGPVLAEAVSKTFACRGTTVPPSPQALTRGFAQSEAKPQQWAAFLRRGKPMGMPDSFAQVVSEIAAFLLPVTEAVGAGSSFDQRWVAPGPWQQRKP